MLGDVMGGPPAWRRAQLGRFSASEGGAHRRSYGSAPRERRDFGTCSCRPTGSRISKCRLRSFHERQTSDVIRPSVFDYKAGNALIREFRNTSATKQPALKLAINPCRGHFPGQAQDERPFSFVTVSNALPSNDC